LLPFKLLKNPKPFIIAELGTAHDGSISRAKALIDAAREAGADAVKFQIVYADEILHPNTGTVPLPGGDTPLYDVFKKLEVPASFFAELKEYAEARDAVFLATPFGLRSATCLKALHPAAVKIASPELNYTQLLRETVRWGIPLFLSTGVSKLGDIERALELVRAVEDEGLLPPPSVLLHCITAYPAPASEYNLRLLSTMRSLFGVETGVSDHSLDAELVPAIAAALGAAAIEKHFCLDRADGGLDDPIALPPNDFAKMVKAVEMSAALRVQFGEEGALAELRRHYGAEAVNAALGNGVKRLAKSEEENYGRTNRSIHALVSIAAGGEFTAQNIAVLRTEKILKPGLPPFYFDKILGRRARSSIPAGEGICFEDIG
jgi:sialic acid synthase SpsE